MRKLIFFVILSTFKAELSAQILEFVSTQTIEYNPNKIPTASKEISKHTIKLEHKTITLECDECIISPKPETIHNLKIINQHTNNPVITFLKGDYQFYVLTQKKKAETTVKSIYLNGDLKFNYYP